MVEGWIWTNRIGEMKATETVDVRQGNWGQSQSNRIAHISTQSPDIIHTCQLLTSVVIYETK